jgi:hypothetical protein
VDGMVSQIPREHPSPLAIIDQPFLRGPALIRPAPSP